MSVVRLDVRKIRLEPGLETVSERGNAPDSPAWAKFEK
jgi:hypothetical protein